MLSKNEEHSIRTLTEESEKYNHNDRPWTREKQFETYSTKINCILKSKEKHLHPINIRKRHINLNLHKDNFKRMLLNIEFNPNNLTISEDPIVKPSWFSHPHKSDKKILQKNQCIEDQKIDKKCRCLTIEKDSLTEGCESPECLMKSYKPQNFLLSFPKREHSRMMSFTPVGLKYFSPKGENLHMRRAGSQSISPITHSKNFNKRFENDYSSRSRGHFISSRSRNKNSSSSPYKSDMRLPIICKSIIC